MAALRDADTCVIDASTAHRVADGWTYGFPELSKGIVRPCSLPSASPISAAIRTGAIAILRPLVDAGIVRANSDARRVRRFGL